MLIRSDCAHLLYGDHCIHLGRREAGGGRGVAEEGRGEGRGEGEKEGEEHNEKEEEEELAFLSF